MECRWSIIGLAIMGILALATPLVAAKAPAQGDLVVSAAPAAALSAVAQPAAQPVGAEPAASEAIRAPLETSARDEATGTAGLRVVDQNGTCISGYVIDTYYQPQGAGWTVRVTLEGGTAQARVLDARGAFRFDNLPGGTYLVELELPAGWMPFTPASFRVTLSGTGTGCAQVRIQLEAQPCLDVVKLDADGRMGFAQPVGLPGWGITASSKLATVNGVTDGQGRLRFTNLATGVWTVTEEMRIGWMPAPGTNVQQRITLVAPRVPGACQTVQFLSRQVHTGCIQVLKVDTAGKPLAGWRITLSRPDGTQAPITRVTDALGHAIFKDLALGGWHVKEEVREKWRSMGASEADIEVTAPGRCVTVTFKNEALGCVDGYKINHLDWGLGGWTIKAQNAAGEAYTTVTDAAGFFQFHQLTLGTWTISEVAQQGWEAVTPAAFEVEVTKPFVCEHVRFKNRATVACLDVVKRDARDGAGLPGWQIHIKPAFGGAMQTGTTDGTGHVRFDGLTPGTYVISETLQTGWTPVTPQHQIVTLQATGTCAVVTVKNRPIGTQMPPPKSSGCRFTHRVVRFDTLFSLARRYGTTVNAIKRANGMWNDTIYIGRTLCIP